VDLAKLSLWLVTLAKDHPFTFLDHALRHGDSLVGLDFDQIRAGHWKPGKQVELAELTLREALAEAIAIRQEIVDLAEDTTPAGQRLKETKLSDAEDALRHARLLADLVVGAFFAHDKDKDRGIQLVTRDQKVFVKLGEGNQTLELFLDGKELTITSRGDLKLTADGAITIDSKKKVEIKAQSGIDVNAGGGQATIKGTKVAIN